MGPETRGDGNRGIAVRSQELDETIIGETTCLGQTIHALAYFNVNIAVMNEFGQVIFEHDGFGDHTYGDAHVGEVFGFHWCFQVKVFEINRYEFAIGSRDDAVEHCFDSGEIGSLGADVAIVVDAVAANSEADTPRVGFFGAIGGDDSEISGFGAFGDFGDGDKDHGTGTGGHISTVTLAEASDFVGAGGAPESTFAAVAEFGVLGDLAGVGIEGITMEGVVRMKGQLVGYDGGGGRNGGRSSRVKGGGVGAFAGEGEEAGTRRGLALALAAAMAALGASAVVEGSWRQGRGQRTGRAGCGRVTRGC